MDLLVGRDVALDFRGLLENKSCANQRNVTVKQGYMFKNSKGDTHVFPYEKRCLECL